MNWFRQQSFTLGLVAAVILAFWLPEGGMRGGWLRSETTTVWGVILIFFLQGLSLPTRVLAEGVLNWKLHLFVQAWVFLLSPLLMTGIIFLVYPTFSPDVWAGFWFLAVLPTTISSAVAMTALARGDTAGALFNATLANTLGVLVVPLWTVVLISGQVHFQSESIGFLLGDLARMILFPLLIGQLLRPWVVGKSWFGRLSPRFKFINNGVILFIVYAAFSNSVAAEHWAEYGALFLGKVALLVGIYAVLMTLLTWWSARAIPGGRSFRIAAYYCASQKSIATGVPMANAIFAGAAASGQLDLGLILLPLMICHPLQLFLGGLLVATFGGQQTEDGSQA